MQHLLAHRIGLRMSSSNGKIMQKMQRRFYKLEGECDDYYLDGGETAELQNKWVFEIAWEVCNKGR